jgi:hypothetical protein
MKYGCVISGWRLVCAMLTAIYGVLIVLGFAGIEAQD